MGNNSVKSEKKEVFTPEELRMLEAAFSKVSGSSDKLPVDKLVKTFSGIIDDHLAKATGQYLFTSTFEGKPKTIQFIQLDRFAEPYYIVSRGTFDEKMNMLLGSMEIYNNDSFYQKQIETYVCSVIKSYVNIQHKIPNSTMQSWTKIGYISTERSSFALTKGLLRNMTKARNTLPEDNLLEWIQATPTFLNIWQEVFVYLYNHLSGKSIAVAEDMDSNCIIPELSIKPKNSNYRPIIEIPQVMYVNSLIPLEFRKKWRYLFSSKIDGQSFSTMLGRILNKGPTLLIVEDEDQYIFGGYAPESWKLGPKFLGDNTSVLYTLSPAVRSFTATGYNNHYQYLNLNQQTMPNGLGMGGQFNFWGLFIDNNYGEGQSVESCTTYSDYVQLSKRKQFKIHNMEVWGVGDEPIIGEDEDGPQSASVLDSHLEDKVMLDLAGKHMHSDGFRDPDLLD